MLPVFSPHWNAYRLIMRSIRARVSSLLLTIPPVFHVFLPQIFARAARYAHPIKKKGDESLNTIQKSSQDSFNEIRRKMNDWLGKEERDFFFNATFL